MTVERVEILEAPVVLELSDGTRPYVTDEESLLELLQEHGLENLEVCGGRFRVKVALFWTEEGGDFYHERCIFYYSPDGNSLVYTEYPCVHDLCRVLSFACEEVVFKDPETLSQQLMRYVADGSRFVLEEPIQISGLLQVSPSALYGFGTLLSDGLASGKLTLHLMYVYSGETMALVVEPERFAVKQTAILPVMA